LDWVWTMVVLTHCVDFFSIHPEALPLLFLHWITPFATCLVTVLFKWNAINRKSTDINTVTSRYLAEQYRIV
jgi:hypothetical protein